MEKHSITSDAQDGDDGDEGEASASASASLKTTDTSSSLKTTDTSSIQQKKTPTKRRAEQVPPFLSDASSLSDSVPNVARVVAHCDVHDASKGLEMTFSDRAASREPTSTSTSTHDAAVRPGAFSNPMRALGARPIWEQRGFQQQNQERIEEHPQVPCESDEGCREGDNPPPSRRRFSSLFRFSPTVEASPVMDAETVIYATSVSSEETQKRRRLYLVLVVILIVTGAVCTVIGVVVSSSGDGDNHNPPLSSLNICDTKPRKIIRSRDQCRCFGEIAPLEPRQAESYTNFKKEIEGARNITFDDFNATDCVLDNLGIHALMETVPYAKSVIFSNFSHRDRHTVIAESFTVAKFYIALNGDDWFHNDGWMTTQPLCEWYGVECTISGRVSGIFLGRNNVSGNLDGSAVIWGELIRKIRLGDNHLTGTIPSDIFLDESLRALDLRNNRLNGTLPTQYITDAINTINLANNSLTGTLPTELGKLHRLRNLQLEENQLTGTIPTELSSMTSLEDFSIHHNNINGTLPEGMSKLTYLEIINVRNNSLTGTIPSSYGNTDSLKRLGFMDLSYNNFSGMLPPRLEKCKSDLIDTILIDCWTLGINATDHDEQQCTNKCCLFCSETLWTFADINF